MQRDVSEIPTIDVNCIRIIDDKTLQVYTDTTTTNFKLISDKYMATETMAANTPPTDTVCYTVAQIETLPSAFDFMTPPFWFMAIASAALLFYAAYRLIIYPFWRRTV